MDELSRTANERIVLAKSWLKLWGGPPLKHPASRLTDRAATRCADRPERTELAAAIASSHTEPTRRHAGNLAGRNSGWGEFGGETGGAKLIAQSQAELAVLSQVKVAA